MLKDPKAETLLTQLSAVYGDSEVQQYPDLQAQILSYATQLQKDENYQLVATQVNRYLSRFTLAHKLAVPATVTKLFQATTKTAKAYEGVATATFLSQVWF